MENKCSNCTHWSSEDLYGRIDDNELGECRRFPPTLTARSEPNEYDQLKENRRREENTMFPVTVDTQICGEYKEKE